MQEHLDGRCKESTSNLGPASFIKGTLTRLRRLRKVGSENVHNGSHIGQEMAYQRCHRCTWKIVVVSSVASFSSQGEQPQSRRMHIFELGLRYSTAITLSQLIG